MPTVSLNRIAPQSVVTLQVSTASTQDITDLQNAFIYAGMRTSLATASGLTVPNLWRLTVSQPGRSDQIAYPGDWIVVTDATHASTGWELSPTSAVEVYSDKSSRPEVTGSLADFVAAYHAVVPLSWPATEVGPTTKTQDDSILLTFAQPTSPTGPFAYQFGDAADHAVTPSDVTSTSGVVTATLPKTAVGPFTIHVTDTNGATEVSLPSTEETPLPAGTGDVPGGSSGGGVIGVQALSIPALAWAATTIPPAMSVSGNVVTIMFPAATSGTAPYIYSVANTNGPVTVANTVSAGGVVILTINAVNDDHHYTVTVYDSVGNSAVALSTA